MMGPTSDPKTLVYKKTHTHTKANTISNECVHRNMYFMVYAQMIIFQLVYYDISNLILAKQYNIKSVWFGKWEDVWYTEGRRVLDVARADVLLFFRYLSSVGLH
jgi:hypothetical protein